MAQDRIHITLEDEAVVAFVRERVRSGEYASETEVVRDVLSMVAEEKTDLDRWLKEVGAERFDSLQADPSSTITADQLEANLAERRRRRTALAS